MTADWLAAAASLATFVVIAASAIAAIVQLRHVYNSNQLAFFNDFRHETETPEFRAAISFIIYEYPQRVQDPAFRDALMRPNSEEWLKIREVGNLLDSTAAIVKHGMVDRDLACDMLYSTVIRTWETLAPLIATRRAELGYAVWEDFEYFVLLCRRFRARFPDGTYPRGEERVALPAAWERDRASTGSA